MTDTPAAWAPRPWRINPLYPWKILDANGNSVAVTSTNKSYPQELEITAFIVSAVNAQHPPLARSDDECGGGGGT